VEGADQAFESEGGGTRAWLVSCFLPTLEDAGLRIVGDAMPADLVAAVRQADQEFVRHNQLDYPQAFVRDHLLPAFEAVNARIEEKD
jgi:hypothetical protein